MNYSTNRSVPFEITDINHGFQQAKGLMKVDKNGIELEFEVKDSLVGIFKSGIKNVQLSYAGLESVAVKKGWFSSKIILKGVSMKVFNEVPGTEQATCALKIKRAYRQEAESLVSQARMYLSEYRLNRMEGEGSDQ